MAQVEVTGSGGAMACGFCGRTEADRFNGTAYFMDMGETISLLFACSECDLGETLLKARFLAELRGCQHIWVCGPAHLTGKTDQAWAEYVPEGAGLPR